jgi:hypothetical protein
MAITAQHVTGFAIGLGVAAVGFYMYKKNQPSVDEWLRKQGIEVPSRAVADYGTLTLEELVLEKERLEDLIAEREMAAQERADQGPSEPATQT